MDTGLTIDDLKNELKAVRNSRMAIYSAAQSYSRPGLSITRAQLRDLSIREQEILRALSRLSGGGVLVIDKSGSIGPSSTQDSSFTDLNA